MSLTVREKYLWQQMTDEKFAGMSARVPGNIHYVVPGTSATHFAYVNDRHKRVYATAALALADCVAGRGDAIVFLPGAHTVATTSLAMSKAGVMWFGPEAWMGKRTQRPSASITTSITGDEIANVTAANCGIYGMKIIPITAGVGIDFSSVAHGLEVQDCYIDMETPVVSTSTVGIKALGAAVDVAIRGCTAVADGAQGNAIVTTATLNMLIERSSIICTAGTWASAILCGAAVAGLQILTTQFQSYGTAITVGVNGTGATIARGVYVSDCRFSDTVTVAIDNFDAGECEIGENYQLGVGGTDGGVLIVAIT